MNKLPIGVSLPAQYQLDTSSVNMAKVRAERFEKMLKSYVLSKGNVWSHNSSQRWLADMMADAFHFIDANGSDVDFVLKLARSHHESEKIEDLRSSLQVDHKASAPTH